MEVLSHPLVLGAAGVMYVAEFIADKVPFFTPIWDAVHTLIRPMGAALLAFQASANLSPLAQTAAVLAAGSIALGTHSTKAGFRLLAHATPEPVTHSTISVLEDFSVVGLLLLAYRYPEIAVPLLVALLIGLVLLAPVVFRVLRFGVHGMLGRVQSWVMDADRVELPRWAANGAGEFGLSRPPEWVPCFTRSGPRLGRLRNAYLAAGDGRLWVVYKKLTGIKTRPLTGAAEFECGLVYDVLRAGEDSVYITKEWARHARRVLNAGEACPPATVPRGW